MRNKKISILTLVALVLVIVLCIVFLNKDSMSEQTESPEAETEILNQAEQVNDGTETDTASESMQVVQAGSEPSKSEQKLKDTLIKYTVGNLNIRALPQSNSDLKGVVDNFYTKLYYFGETAQGYGSDNVLHTWYKIDTDTGVNGWVRSDLVISQDANVTYPYEGDNEGTDYYKFTDDALNIRSEPSYNSSLVGKVTDCNTYIHGCCSKVASSQMGLGSDGQLHYWIKVIVNSKLEGWVREDLMIPTASEVWYDDIFIKNTTTPLNVRALPQHDSTLVLSVKNADTKLYYNGVCKQGLGSDGAMYDWYQVEISNAEKGWVRSDLVKSVIYS